MHRIEFHTPFVDIAFFVNLIVFREMSVMNDQRLVHVMIFTCTCQNKRFSHPPKQLNRTAPCGMISSAVESMTSHDRMDFAEEIEEGWQRAFLEATFGKEKQQKVLSLSTGKRKEEVDEFQTIWKNIHVIIMEENEEEKTEKHLKKEENNDTSDEKEFFKYAHLKG